MKEIIGVYAGVKFQQINGDNFSIEFYGDFPLGLQGFIKDFADLAYKCWRKIQEAKGKFGNYKDIPMELVDLLHIDLLKKYVLLKEVMASNGWEPVFNEFRPTWRFMEPEDKSGNRQTNFCSLSGYCWFQPAEKK